ncbi:COG1470 family protein [Elizabethkingia miricola]|uniref:COG1470 family protein n=1 Tax=Elizabethkingia miricola TaxID=172045 RepID=UPI00099A4EFB|nr:hypothetical protein [Elizabethkingia miricola]OPC08749.1 hypothetical protein BAY01_15030 [Elizabethkingia miricola]
MAGITMCYAQKSAVSIETDQKLSVFNEDMVSVLLKISNNTEIERNLDVDIQTVKGLRVINNISSIHLKANEKAFLPVKIFVEKNQPAGTATIKYAITESSLTLATAETSMTVQSKRGLKIVANEPQVLMYKVGDSIKISTQVYNSGNREENVEVIASFPQADGRDLSFSKKIKLEPFVNKEVSFSKIVDKDLLKMELFTVNVAGLNADKEFFGNAIIIVQNALGNRKYVDPAFINFYRPAYQVNHISLSSRNAFLNYDSSYNLDLHTEFYAGGIKGIVNVNGTYWSNNSTKPLFTNTWIRLEGKGVGVQLGNLNASDLEINLVGRGAEVSVNPFTNKRSMIRVGAVEKSYNLIDPLDLNNSSRGYSTYAKSSISLNEKESLDNSVILDNDPYQRSFILMNEYHYNNNKQTYYDLRLGYGYTSTKGEVSHTASSVAAGLNLNTSFNKYTFSSNNYYSSSYYPGIRKGNTVFEERLFKNFDKFNIWVGYSLNNYNPKSIDPQYQYNTVANRSKVEMGTSFTIARNTKLSIIPQWSTERSNVFVNSSFQSINVDFNTAFINTALNYTSPDYKSSINLVLSNGYSRYVGFTSNSFIYRLQANWYYKNFMLSANYQKGNFMLYEGNYNNSLSDNTERISAIANYKISLLNKRLNVLFGSIFNSDKFIGKSFSFNTNLDYRILSGTKLFASYNLNKYLNGVYRSANNYYQVGIIQDLPSFGEEKSSGKTGNIELFFYYDLNNNGQYDPSVDLPAQDLKTKINNTLFITPKNGNIKYKKVPYGTYMIKAMEDKWYADDMRVTVDRKDVFLTIPLQKTSMVKGKVQYQETTKTQYEVIEVLSGLPVVFQNNQFKNFVFYTNERGEYSAYLPVGHYKVFIDGNALQKNVYVEANQTADIAEGNTSELKPFILKVKERKVEVKRFGIK